MKVLQINAVYGFKSTGVIVKDICDTLLENGDVPFVAYQSTNAKCDNGYKIGNKLDWKFHALYSRIFGKQAYASKCATKKFLRWIDKVKPDIVHLHNLHSNYINLNLLLGYLAKNNIATVITLHDCWYFTGKCSHYVYAKCDKWQRDCGDCPLNKAEVPSWLFDCTSKVVNDKTSRIMQIPNLAIVGCSQWIAGQVKQSKLGNANVRVIRNGVDTEIFTPHESSFRQENGLTDEFVIMGMADKWFNPQNKEVVESIISSLEDNDRIVIVGCNQEQKERFSWCDKVIALGYVKDRKLLSDVYASSNVFVNLTKADTLPTVNMESICCGTPVVTFDCCGSPELVDDGCGYIVSEGDGRQIVEKIKLIKQTPLHFDVKVQQERFDKNNSYKEYLDVYKNLVERN